MICFKLIKIYINLFNSQLDQIRKDLEAAEANIQTETAMSFQNSIPLMMVMRPEDEYNSGNYSAKPAVKILRRPTQQNESRGNDNRPKQPIKTLQQREQEYAEARLRILGSAKNPEDELEAALDKKLSTKSQDFSNTTAIMASSAATTAEITLAEIAHFKNPKGPLSVISNPITNGLISAPPPQSPLIKTPENVLRMPKGPDGSSGFKIRR